MKEGVTFFSFYGRSSITFYIQHNVSCLFPRSSQNIYISEPISGPCIPLSWGSFRFAFCSLCLVLSTGPCNPLIIVESVYIRVVSRPCCHWQRSFSRWKFFPSVGHSMIQHVRHLSNAALGNRATTPRPLLVCPVTRQCLGYDGFTSLTGSSQFPRTPSIMLKIYPIREYGDPRNTICWKPALIPYLPSLITSVLIACWMLFVKGLM